MEEKKENISLLQSSGWSLFQHDTMGKTVIPISVDGSKGSVIRAPVVFGYYYAYSPYGPVGKYTKESLRSFIHGVSSHEKTKKAFFLRIEPFTMYSEEISNNLTSSGFKKVRSVQPEETMILDLRPSEEEILSHMDHDTRYSIRVAERRGVTVKMYEGKELSDDVFLEFWNLFLHTNKRHSLGTYEKKYYKGLFSLHDDCATRLYIAYVDNHPVAAAIVVFFENRATYLYAASARGFGKYNAPTFILWRAIQDAKKSGYEIFDFWGVSTTNKEWAGVTAFKKSFGGELVRYQGTWDYVFNRPKYFAYTTLKKIL